MRYLDLERLWKIILDPSEFEYRGAGNTTKTAFLVAHQAMQGEGDIAVVCENMYFVQNFFKVLLDTFVHLEEHSIFGTSLLQISGPKMVQLNNRNTISIITMEHVKHGGLHGRRFIDIHEEGNLGDIVKEELKYYLESDLLAGAGDFQHGLFYICEGLL